MTASKNFSDEYLEYLTTLIAQLDRSAISQFADLLLQSRENKTTTFFLGNGGSASTATHFVNDVSLGSRQFEKPFRAISLCDNQAVITAIANDDGYENIFLQQLQTLATAGDTIVCISASGNSKNLINAIKTKLWPLGDDVQFVPGHGPMSTFGKERQTNPYVGD